MCPFVHLLVFKFLASPASSTQLIKRVFRKALCSLCRAVYAPVLRQVCPELFAWQCVSRSLFVAVLSFSPVLLFLPH